LIPAYGATEKAFLLLLSFLAATPILCNVSTSDAVIVETIAEYTATYNGIPIKAKRTVSLANNIYEDILDASSLFGTLTQLSRYEFDDNGKLIPLYSYDKRSFFGVIRHEEQTFLWSENKVVYKKKGEVTEVFVPAYAYDTITHRLQLKRDLVEGKFVFEYVVINRGKKQLYKYRKVGEETIETPLGSIETIVLSRKRDNKNRHTTLWFAKNWTYFLVKSEQIENNDSYDMLIQNAVINGEQMIAKNLGDK
jgi:ABC-type Fe3+-hydroxamate transport system substrate-binding protein